jgi:uncharacterized protein YdiU (UPF0061 family)
MSAAAAPLFALEHTFVRDLQGLYEPTTATHRAQPTLVALNGSVAAQLGLNIQRLREPQHVAILAGNTTPPGATPVAMAYAGHQFGNYSPQLGDGRALLLGELIDTHGERHDLHLKGSGRTPFARGGDGNAALGPMLREFIISEAMHALAIPTTRALAVTATGEPVHRETTLPGAVLARIAKSHLRVGTFEYAAARNPTLVRTLADYAIARHFPDIAAANQPYLALLTRIAHTQAELIARWMLVGFVHGVMNTDNMAISGQTIDYGPCAFIDTYDDGTVFSSIDHQGRYAYGNQPAIAQWNLARLAETLLPLLAPTQPAAITAAEAVLHDFADHYVALRTAGLATKLGLRTTPQTQPGIEPLTTELLALLQHEQPDFTQFFRALANTLRAPTDNPHAQTTGPHAQTTGAHAQTTGAVPSQALPTSERFADWLGRWRALLAVQGAEPAAVAAQMDRVNPVYTPRNHLVEAALDAATGGDLAPFRTLVDVLSAPYETRPGLERYAAPPTNTAPYRTFCGT